MKDNHSADLSPAATTIAFDPVIPLLRVPLQAGENDDPSKGPYVLAFKDEDSWHRAWLACESRLSEQCEVGARMGCSIGVSNKCKPPWWKNLFHFGKLTSRQIEEREACEEREMTACVIASRDTCAQYARDTCRPAFADARIAKLNQKIDSRFTTHNFKRVRRWNGKSNVKSADQRLDAKLTDLTRPSEYGSPLYGIDKVTNTPETTNYQGKFLLGESRSQRHWEGPAWGEASVQGDEFESHGDGWAGGLVLPKVGPKQMEPLKDARELTKTDLPIWRHVQEQIMSKLKDLKILRNGA
eukprot:Gb_27688 [translate_table: standard]